ncbi:MAG: acyltransferase [Acidobacteriaceae bacterium]
MTEGEAGVVPSAHDDGSVTAQPPSASLSSILHRLRYIGDADSRFRRYIWRHLAYTVIRGSFYRLFRLTSAGVISIGPHVRIIGPKANLAFGKRCKIDRGSVVQAITRGRMVFGDDVTLCEGVLIRPSGHWGGILGCGMVMGSRSSIGAYSFIGCSGPLRIGDDVMIGPRLTLIAENHNFSDVTKPMNQQGVNSKGITIGSDIWIGSCVTILDGVTVGDHSVIAAGAVVTKDIPPYSIVGGVPARVIRSRVSRAVISQEIVPEGPQA